MCFSCDRRCVCQVFAAIYMDPGHLRISTNKEVQALEFPISIKAVSHSLSPDPHPPFRPLVSGQLVVQSSGAFHACAHHQWTTSYKRAAPTQLMRWISESYKATRIQAIQLGTNGLVPITNITGDQLAWVERNRRLQGFLPAHGDRTWRTQNQVGLCHCHSLGLMVRAFER